ncbi:hypothetical protein LGMK_02240 [Leuconostoc sp. C2]|nr:hypothetical protein LGMK_02240 [Leuconostoc sp. C2]
MTDQIQIIIMVILFIDYITGVGSIGLFEEDRLKANRL